jgi:hypothetical protein
MFSSSCVLTTTIVFGGAPLAVPPTLVEDLGVAFVIEAADDGAVADLREAVSLEDALHTLVVGKGGAAHDLEVQCPEAIGDQELHGLAGIAAAAQVFRAYLYAELAPLVSEVVEGYETDNLSGLVPGFALSDLDDKGLNGRVLPAGQVVAAGDGERDLDRRTAVPGGEFGVPVPLVDLLDILLAWGS